MNRSDTIGKQYAEGFLEYAGDPARITRIGKDLQKISHVLESENSLSAFLTNPTISLQEKKKVMNPVIKKLGLSEEGQRIVLYLLDKKALELAPNINKAYCNLAENRRDTVNVTARSAIPLNKLEKQKIIQWVEKKEKRKVSFIEKIDADIIGGLFVEVGHRIYDGSIRGQLGDMAEHIIGREKKP
ncbi:MAG: ATP synthase F1 subunit delta [Candidatus Theseobacter exili]|nr:ATP synthase F1 subunit delta [Candidatus Theseobacter exili]